MLHARQTKWQPGLKTLFARITLFFSLLLMAMAAFTLWLTDRSAKNYFLEFTQQLNEPVAMYMADNAGLLNDGELDEVALTELSHHAMTINPSLEIYLLDADGTVYAPSLAESNKPFKLEISPINRFLGGDRNFPLFGDYPPDRQIKRTFSVHPLTHEGSIKGYVYVVLGGEKYSTLLERVTSSYVLKDLFFTIMGVFFLTLAAGIVVFSLLTRRLKRLRMKVNALHRTYQTHPKSSDQIIPSTHDDDELTALTRAYDQLTDELTQQYNALEHSDRERRVLVANISHDLRTPLTALSGYIETLQIKLAESDPDLRKYADIAFRQTQKLRILVSQLLELSIINSGEAKPKRESFSLIELLHDIAQDFQIELDRSQLELTIQPGVQDRETYNVEADISLIQRVFENLLINAVEYTPTGGKICIELTKSANKVFISISDSGAGMTSQQINEIFTRYRTGNPCGTTPYNGHTGLGLAIVKGILELHQSTINVSSQSDVGTSFQFTLPCSYRDIAPGKR